MALGCRAASSQRLGPELAVLSVSRQNEAELQKTFRELVALSLFYRQNKSGKRYKTETAESFKEELGSLAAMHKVTWLKTLDNKFSYNPQFVMKIKRLRILMIIMVGIFAIALVIGLVQYFL